MSAITCARCLGGNHRCLTAGCACSCNGARRSAPKAVAGGVLRADRPRRAPTARPGRGKGNHSDPVPADKVLGIVEMLRRYQLTGELA